MEDFLISLLKGIIGVFLLFGTLWVFISFLFSPRKTFGLIHSRWHKPFDSVQFSAKEFYSEIEQAIKKREVSGIKIDSVTHVNYNLLSSSREYLQIRRDDSMFLVCAAPFGTGFFISWWLGKTISLWEDIVPRIPLIGKGLAYLMFSKTFYQMDTETMFKEMVQQSVLEVIDGMTNAKGLRGLSELERRPIDMPESRRI